MEPRIVIAAYRPHEGKDRELLELVERHVPALRASNLITDREPMLMRASDGTLLEVFEWREESSSARAHEDPGVSEVWNAMMEVADFPSLSELVESRGRFPHFTPVALGG